VQFAPRVADDIRLAEKMLIGGEGRETCRGTLEEYLETKTVVVSL
jgi:hypothetical protein